MRGNRAHGQRTVSHRSLITKFGNLRGYSTDVTPDGSNVAHGLPPDQEVDELDETLAADPEDVQYAADIPC